MNPPKGSDLSPRESIKVCLGWLSSVSELLRGSEQGVTSVGRWARERATLVWRPWFCSTPLPAPRKSLGQCGTVHGYVTLRDCSPVRLHDRMKCGCYLPWCVPYGTMSTMRWVDRGRQLVLTRIVLMREIQGYAK
jgi:hypothetical protein